MFADVLRSSTKTRTFFRSASRAPCRQFPFFAAPFILRDDRPLERMGTGFFCYWEEETVPIRQGWRDDQTVSRLGRHHKCDYLPL